MLSGEMAFKNIAIIIIIMSHDLILLPILTLEC